MDGTPLASRFSIATNRLSYCGPAEAEPALYRAILSGRGDLGARNALAGFEALWPYLEALGNSAGLDPLDEKVVEAYWIGNELLDSFPPGAFREILHALQRRGLPASVVRRLERHLPTTPLPCHVFHVAFVGVGAVTGHVPTTLANVEACRPSWATVTDRRASTLRVTRPTLRTEGGHLAWGPERSEELSFDPKVIGEPGIGSPVLIHWGWPALVPTDRQLSALREYTQRALDSANEALPALGVFPADSRADLGRVRS